MFLCVNKWARTLCIFSRYLAELSLKICIANINVLTYNLIEEIKGTTYSTQFLERDLLFFFFLYNYLDLARTWFPMYYYLLVKPDYIFVVHFPLSHDDAHQVHDVCDGTGCRVQQNTYHTSQLVAMLGSRV